MVNYNTGLLEQNIQAAQACIRRAQSDSNPAAAQVVLRKGNSDLAKHRETREIIAALQTLSLSRSTKLICSPNIENPQETAVYSYCGTWGFDQERILFRSNGRDEPFLRNDLFDLSADPVYEIAETQALPLILRTKTVRNQRERSFEQTVFTIEPKTLGRDIYAQVFGSTNEKGKQVFQKTCTTLYLVDKLVSVEWGDITRGILVSNYARNT